MRVKTFFRVLRIIAAVTLFFFCWSFLPLWQAVAFAATPQGQGPAKVRSSESGVRNVCQQPTERFEKALESIRETIAKAVEKSSKGRDITSEIGTIKTKKAEIESADIDFKKEFAATEKKLKDAKLPQEILNRHYNFIKRYENHLSQLKTEIDDIETAKNSEDRQGEKRHDPRLLRFGFLFWNAFLYTLYGFHNDTPFKNLTLECHPIFSNPWYH